MTRDSTDLQLFECVGCGHRTTDLPSRTCPSCGGVMKNISVPRE